MAIGFFYWGILEYMFMHIKIQGGKDLNTEKAYTDNA